MNPEYQDIHNRVQRIIDTSSAIPDMLLSNVPGRDVPYIRADQMRQFNKRVKRYRQEIANALLRWKIPDGL